MLTLYDLRTEYLENPIGIDTMQPRLSWKLDSDKRNVMQTSYHITAAHDMEMKQVLWDSGEVKSEESQHVRMQLPTVNSGEIIYWRVEVTAGGEAAVSETAHFEMGILSPSEWKAEWISPEEDFTDFDTMRPAPYLRKDFEVKQGLVKARIYQTAHGLYEFWINGNRGTKDVFKPGFTSYYERIQYQTYDITDLLTEGKNALAVALGDGWWRGISGGMFRNNFGYKLHYFGQLILEYADGSKEIIGSDNSFKTATGGLLISDMKAGDLYDARLEPNGWKLPDFDDSKWNQVHIIQERKDILIPSRSVPVREMEQFTPEVFKDANGDTILNFKQNIAGYVRMKLKGLTAGQKITLIHGEDMKDGVFSLQNITNEIIINDHIQQVDYIAKGEETEEYCPMFSVFGFQYVKMSGYTGTINPEDFTAVAVYSDCEKTGDFSCSNPLLNQLVSNSRWSQKGNFMDVPTDCPTRERSTWTGDSQVYCKTASDFMNVYPFFEKWLQDIELEQAEDGKIFSTVPATNTMHNEAELTRLREKADPANPMEAIMLGGMKTGNMIDGSAGWGDTAVITPYTMYLCYGDKQILENQFESAKRWVDYMASNAKNQNDKRTEAPEYHNYTDGELDGDYIWDTCFHYGEWLEAGDSIMSAFMQPEALVPTAFLCYSSRLLSEMAGILGREEEAKQYAQFSEKVKLRINKYHIKSDGSIKENRQSHNVRALAFHLYEDEKRQAIADKLAEMIKENNYHLNTGFLATPFILPVLAEHGYPEIAFKILEQETSPSWLYNVKMGATTILETWDGMETHEGSYNHYSFGAVCDFLFSGVCGIRPVIDAPGYKQFIIKPLAGGTLTHAKAKYESIYGTIESAWIKEGNDMVYHFTVPVNTKATVMLPKNQADINKIRMEYPAAAVEGDSIIFELGSGQYTVKA